MLELGHVERLELRSVWASEPHDFTPWLAMTENLERLGSAIGMDLVTDQIEKGVGPFSADILCKNTLDDSWVVIENQIEKTDHTHLGQVLTYAAGLDASTVIWIASRFTDEHRAAIDWLNKNTTDNIQFFGVEIEILKIGSSLPAPQFMVVANPNDWSRNVSATARRSQSGEMNDTQKLQLGFWSGLSEYLAENTAFQLRSPRPQGWADFSLGKTNTLLRLSISTQARKLAAGVYLYDNMKPFFEDLTQHKTEIESMLGYSLIWENDRSKQTAVIKVEKALDLSNEDCWKEGFVWFAERLSDINKVFRPLMKG